MLHIFEFWFFLSSNGTRPQFWKSQCIQFKFIYLPNHLKETSRHCIAVSSTVLKFCARKRSGRIHPISTLTLCISLKRFWTVCRSGCQQPYWFFEGNSAIVWLNYSFWIGLYFVQLVLFYTATVQQEWSFCPLSGGYDFRTYINRNREVRTLYYIVIITSYEHDYLVRFMINFVSKMLLNYSTFTQSFNRLRTTHWLATFVTLYYAEVVSWRVETIKVRSRVPPRWRFKADVSATWMQSFIRPSNWLVIWLCDQHILCCLLEHIHRNGGLIWW
jgi:hypothetical protein